MLDVGTTSENGEDDADLAVFVDRLAAEGSDRPTAMAKAQIRRAIGTGASPPGLRRLAEALAASVGELPPSPRRPSEDSGSVVAAIRANTLVVLDEFDAVAVASAITAMVDDGRRIIVTASTPAELADVRDALPVEAVARSLDRLPSLSPAEMRELRALLATSTPARRARAGQQFPAAAALPQVSEVADLCAQATRSTGSGSGAGMIPALLANLDVERRAAVTSVARMVQRSLAGLPPRSEREWVWTLLSELIYSRHRATFDRLIDDTAKAMAAIERARPRVSLSGPPPAGAVALLKRYHAFLETGGRARSFFKSPLQREVQPVLQLARIESRPVETGDDVAILVEHLELGERLTRIAAECAELSIPAARNASELAELVDGLARVAAAVRAVGALRHDVLFIASDSPLSVPDIETADQVARAMLEYADHGSPGEAGRRLDAMADKVASHSQPSTMSSECRWAVAALRARDLDGYLAALDALGAARREARDENRRAALLHRLSESAPRLADAWTMLAEQNPAGLGLIAFVPVDAVLTDLPPSDSADVVLVLGGSRLGMERLLLAAAAPRMIAVIGPGEPSVEGPTLVSILQRASAVVIRGRAQPPSGNVLQINPGAPRSGHARIGQAGA